MNYLTILNFFFFYPPRRCGSRLRFFSRYSLPTLLPFGREREKAFGLFALSC